MSSGIIAAQDGKTIDDRPLAYSSEHSHLKVDARPDMNRLKIYEGKCGVSVLNVVAPTFGTRTIKQQTFYQIKHGLTYIPRASAYMLIRDAPPVLAGLIGWYAGGYLQKPGFPESETIFFRVDAEYFSFIHKASTFDTVPYNSILQDVRVRAKIIINSNEAVDEPYDSRISI